MDIFNQLLREKPGRRVDKLSGLAGAVSIVTFALMWIAFIVNRGKDPETIYPIPMIIIMLHLGTLLVYVPLKEALRWKQQDHHRSVGKRIGEVFIPLWVISLLLMGAMQFFSEGYFNAPQGMLETTLGALTIGGVSSISKGLHDCKNGVCPEDGNADETKTPPSDEGADDV